MRMFGFNIPQERVSPRFWTANVSSAHNTGRFMRNAVLDGMTYGTGDFLPSYIKTADLIHPFVGTYSLYLTASNVYGAVAASAAETSVPGILNGNAFRDGSSWTPGGSGIGAWFSVSLPEASLADRYIVRTKAANCPLSWTLQGSLDGETWTDLHVVENTGVWASTLESKEFVIPEETRGVYLYYKLNITASNATTTTLWRFRLLRPANICPLGDFVVDASVLNPLVLSFMDGFSSGVPVDHVEIITTPQIITIFDALRVPTDPAILASGAFSLFAVRNGNGSVAFEVQGEGGDMLEYLSGGMTGSADRGFAVLSGSHLPFGRTSYSAGAPNGEIARIDGLPFYVKKAWASAYAFSGTFTMDVSYDNVTYIREWTQTVSKNTVSTEKIINRPIYKIKVANSDSSIVCRLYGSGGIYRYRMAGGLLYEKSTNPITAWTPVQKIKLATGVISGGEVVRIVPNSTYLEQWQVNADLAPGNMEP